MSAIYLYDDASARDFQPFALTRPMADMIAGTALQRERWQTALQMPVAGVVTSPHLADFDESGASPVVRGGIPAGSVIANARFVPKLTQLPRYVTRGERGAGFAQVAAAILSAR